MRGVRSYLAAGLCVAALCLLGPARAAGQADETSRSWNQPVEPFRVIANVYYVGASDVTSFLITTPSGHILLDSGFAETVPHIRRNVARLGFRMSDIKILINSHAHIDHAGGLALLKEETGARLFASAADAVLLAAGGRGDFHFGDRLAFAPVKADRVLRDRDRVELGGVRLTARLTPGHTKGSTTWTMRVREGGRRYDVLFAGSTSVPGYRLLGNAQYPNMVADYERTFRVMRRLPCDVFLGPHGSFFSMREKAERQARGEQPNPFIDPRGYRAYVERTEKAFREQLRKERQAVGTESGSLTRGGEADAH